MARLPRTEGPLVNYQGHISVQEVELVGGDAGKEVAVVTVPQGATVMLPICGAAVDTAFNGTTPTVDIGITGSLQKYGADLALDALGFVPCAVAVGLIVDTAGGEKIVAKIKGTGVTTGRCRIVFAFIKVFADAQKAS